MALLAVVIDGPAGGAPDAVRRLVRVQPARAVAVAAIQRGQVAQNVSHGCTNMAPADAEWMFNNSKMGDVVNFTGSSRAFKPTEGIGVWVYDFAGRKAQSALV